MTLRFEVEYYGESGKGEIAAFWGESNIGLFILKTERFFWKPKKADNDNDIDNGIGNENDNDNDSDIDNGIGKGRKEEKEERENWAFSRSAFFEIPQR